jgi:hypothetical protein
MTMNLTLQHITDNRAAHLAELNASRPAIIAPLLMGQPEETSEESPEDPE